MYEYRAVIRHVHDGDTVRADVDLGWNVWRKNESLRLAGIAAPELAEDGGATAREYLRLLLPVGREVTIRTERDRDDKYGRMLATIYAPGNVNDALLRTGHAVPYS